MTSLKNIIAPAFYDVHKSIKNNEFTEYMLKGGRGSTKSSFISIEIVLDILKDKDANALCIRKVKETLRDSVYEQMKWAIEMLGVSHLWEFKVSPLKIIYIPTGQQILFRGADNPKKLKSTKVSKGYIKNIWFEELEEFGGMEEIRSINQSLMRGGKSFNVFYSFNPPKNNRSWTNQEVLEDKPSRLINHSDYRTVPKAWLGEQFFIEAEHLQKVNDRAYRHEYLGEPVGIGTEVFTNLEIREISKQEIETFGNINRGMDFGYATDPTVYTCNYLDIKKKRLYIFHEDYLIGASNSTLADAIKKENKVNRLVYGDSSDPRTINELKQYGIRIVGAKKGKDSVDYGIKYLQDLELIVIDNRKCPNTAREFQNYALNVDKLGNVIPKFVDADNHSIDATRYALSDIINRKKAKVIDKSTLF